MREFGDHRFGQHQREPPQDEIDMVRFDRPGASERDGQVVAVQDRLVQQARRDLHRGHLLSAVIGDNQG